MNRRKFLAGLAATTAAIPLVGVIKPVSETWVVAWEKNYANLLPLQYSFAQTKEIFAANIMKLHDAQDKEFTEMKAMWEGVSEQA